MTGLHFHPLRVRSVTPETDEAMVVAFDVPPALADAFRWQPGQYLTLRHELDGEDLRRSYSICAGLDDGELRVGVRRVRGGRFSTWLNTALRAGDTLEVMPPQGRFVVPPPAEGDPRPRHYLGVAGGSGITPILSIAKTALAREPGSRFTLVYGNRRSASTMFKEALEDLKNRYLTRLSLHHVFSEEVLDAPLSHGLLDRGKLAEFLGPVIDVRRIAHAFVCGPYAMNDEAEAALRAAGLDAARIHIERFGIVDPSGTAAAAPDVAPGDAAECRMTVVRDGLTREVPFHAGDASVLAAAAKAGLDLPFSCKSGVCGTCRAHLGAGEVRMSRNFALEPADLAAGFILTCQAHPLTPTLTVSFDVR